MRSLRSERWCAQHRQQQSFPERNREGFTLIELLVVIAIISVLAGLVTAGVGVARRKATRNQCSMEMQKLKSGIEAYFSDWGDYPPSDMERFYDGDFVVTSNGVNDGIEGCVAHLARQGKGGPYYEFEDESIANNDGDSLTNSEFREELDWIFGDAQLREVIDPYDNPLVYIHNRNYERGPWGVQNVEGEKVSVMARRSEKMKTFEGLTTYQLFSLGPDGKFGGEDGGDDLIP